MFYPSLARPQLNLSTAEGVARRAEADVELLKQDVERLLMITEVLWTILKEKHGYDDNELIRRVTEIDLRDGRLDGRVAAEPPPECPYCHHVMTKHRPVCMYCGKPVAVNPFER